MSFAIWGMGTALPSQSISQERAAEVINQASGYDADQSRWVESLYRGAGVHRRHLLMLEHLDEILESPGGVPRFTTGWRMGRYEESIIPMAAEASGRALEASGIAASEITHLVTVSCTGFSAPGFDLALFDRLKLRPVVQRTHVGFMGCHGAMNGLRVAAAYAGSDPSARVLVCAAELTSLHFRYEPDPRLSVVNALFADGSAAVVGRAGLPDHRGAWTLTASGSVLVPDSAGAMTWRIGDQGFEMTLSPKVGALIGEHLRPWLASWLDSLGLSIGDIPTWAIHPGGPKILDAAESALQLSGEATEDSREILAAFGNMSSPTVLFLLDRLRRRNAPLPCVSLAFGPGLVVEAALFT
ncbi:type III polyketide synthase [Tundrisphaera lichenicola]|uniref:type III polyketide synthase n=1 Tax=Tundrisphaera lichenicola TaxID=2029860 RepID=UPI003EBBD096